MDEIVMLEAIERYMSGEMSPQERSFFEELRKTNPEVDQLVVEHSYFLQGLEKYGAARNFKHLLHETEAKLMAEGVIHEPKLKGKAKVVFLWNKYKRNMAVAASIAGFISLLTLGLTLTFTTKYSDSYKYLVKEINKTNREVSTLKSKSTSHHVPAAPVKIEPKADFTGTGFLIDGKGYLVTNAHVISKMKNIYVKSNKGDYYSAAVLFTDATVDLAILKITDTSYKTITNLPYSVRKTNSDLGEQFFTLGFPRNEIVYGEGYVSAKSGNDGDSTAYQLTVSANPGNSGGPVISQNGEIIGIITAKDAKSDGVVYAAKSKNIFKLLDEVKKDSTKQNIKIPAGNSLKGMDRVQQVKKMEDYVFMIVGSSGQ
ncbi:MAG TPA: trypsin-like peptidase domain-containing protein [Ferruginibacter sp.]|nr:trypsin-like peptidase domain-containing protein [Ferruginibacter sp.]HMP20089.1 trypsin-like peptidase domain-containing protein [Ferruginibacter sp.]